MREAAVSSAVWVAFGVGFGLLIWAWSGGTHAGEYFAGYLIEKSLSIDNIFVFALLFSYFAIPARNQHRLLFWGVLGALVFRAIFIGAGAALLESFLWTIYPFRFFLVFFGVERVRHGGADGNTKPNPGRRLGRPGVPLTVWGAALVPIETTDILFPVD